MISLAAAAAVAAATAVAAAAAGLGMCVWKRGQGGARDVAFGASFSAVACTPTPSFVCGRGSLALGSAAALGVSLGTPLRT
jgi:hypothetical protein